MEIPKTAAGGRISAAREAGPRKEWTLSDSLRERVIACAQQDAAQGVYMGPEFLCLRRAEVETVAPDRAALARAIDRQNEKAIREVREADERWLRLLSGGKYQVKRASAGIGSAIHVLDENGDEVLTYTAGVGWQSKESPAENRVHGVLKAVYFDAYHTARKERKAAQGGLETKA